MLKKHMILLLVSISLTACGTMPEDRAISGAGIGAASGAIVGAVTGLTVLQGAVIGATAGALTGALTDKDEINLGKPAWQHDTASSSQTAAPANQTMKADTAPVDATGKQLVMEIQSGLASLGYNPGPVDGIAGQRTRTAIRTYQEDHSLLVDGQASPALAEHIISTRSNLSGKADAQNTTYPL